ncbi:MAG: DUF1786 family protein [Desulfobacterales bacterium]|jgi:uncharacterized protein (DUF1786 family)
MGRYLMVDVGAGTMDILYYDTETDLHYKAVVKSPVRYIAEKAAACSGNLLITGCEMGGGPITKVLQDRAKTSGVLISTSAAATLHHNLEKVRSWDINIITDEEAEALRDNKQYSEITLTDLDADRIQQIVDGFGVAFEFDAVAVCAQDHGVPPEGESHLDFRHNMFKFLLEEKPYAHALLFKDDEVPSEMNRLSSLAKSAGTLPATEVYVMDSGMAAILGASQDVLAKDKNKIFILDVATSHTIGAAMRSDEIAGFFEYHTVDITLERLEALLRDLGEGKLEHRQILMEGGHGAFMRKDIGFDDDDVIIATGPKRKLVENSSLPIVFGAPLGDNMMTGTVGLLEAIRRRKGLAPIVYI